MSDLKNNKLDFEDLFTELENFNNKNKSDELKDMDINLKKDSELNFQSGLMGFLDKGINTIKEVLRLNDKDYLLKEKVSKDIVNLIKESYLKVQYQSNLLKNFNIIFSFLFLTMTFVILYSGSLTLSLIGIGLFLLYTFVVYIFSKISSNLIEAYKEKKVNNMRCDLLIKSINEYPEVFKDNKIHLHYLLMQAFKTNNKTLDEKLYILINNELREDFIDLNNIYKNDISKIANLIIDIEKKFKLIKDNN